jgi:thiol-disulfide isomerase/thioredoxin
MVTTDKPLEGDGERGGRWKGSSKSECGMHVAQDANSLYDIAKLATRVRDGYSWDQKASLRAAAAGVLTVTEDNFEQVVVKEPGHILLEMYAPWCPHCQEFEPTYNKIAAVAGKLKQGGVRLARMDRWQNKVPDDFEARFAMSGFPTMFLVLEGCRYVLFRQTGDWRGCVIALLACSARAAVPRLNQKCTLVARYLFVFPCALSLFLDYILCAGEGQLSKQDRVGGHFSCVVLTYISTGVCTCMSACA